MNVPACTPKRPLSAVFTIINDGDIAFATQTKDRKLPFLFDGKIEFHIQVLISRCAARTKIDTQFIHKRQGAVSITEGITRTAFFTDRPFGSGF